jgi:hypothetical protein
LDPREWLKLAYETFGAKHPAFSLISVMIIWALIGGAFWQLGANLYEKSRNTPLPTTQSPTPGASPQTGPASVSGDCNAVNTGNAGKADSNCPPPKQEKK